MSAYKIDVLKNNELVSLAQLQEENLKHLISEMQAKDQGFLTFKYSEEFIKQMMDVMSQPVAKVGDVLAGYAFATSVGVASTNELLSPLVKLADKIIIKDKALSGYRYYLMGQICVKEGYRGLGIFDALYQKHKELYASAYDYLVTEISVHNTRSLAAHKRVGFKIVSQYNQEGTEWNVVAWDLK